jgi:hypothetical protein
MKEMINKKILILISLFLFLLLLVGCFGVPPVNLPCIVDKPTVVTYNVSNIGETNATAKGIITVTGGENCTVQGFQYGLSQTPTWDKHSSGSFGIGFYSEDLSGLTPDTKYYVRAYATNCAGTSYGDWDSFNTLAPCTTGTVYISTPLYPFFYTIYIDGNYWGTTGGSGNIALYGVPNAYHVFYAEATDCDMLDCWYGYAYPTIVCGENNVPIDTYLYEWD